MDTVITADNLKKDGTIKLPQQPEPDLTLAGIPGGVYDSIQNEYNTLNEKVKQGDAQTQDDAQGILNLMQDLTGRAQDTATANETLGVNKATEDQNKFVTQLSDLNASASSLNREAQAIPLQIQEQFKNTGATDRGVSPITTGKLRENALRALSIAQQSDIAAAALTGSQIRLQAAKDKVQQMIDIKYKPMEDALAIKKEQYSMNKDILDRYDKKRSEALNLTIRKEERELADKKENEKLADGFIINAIQGNAPQSLVSQARELIKKGAKATEVASILGRYSMSKSEILEQDIKQLQKNKLSAELTAAAAAKGISAKDLPLIVKSAEDKVNKIQGLLDNNKGIRASSGVLKRAAGLSTSIRDWRADVKNVLSDLTVDELGRVKASGVTFGALSEGERKAVGDAATALNSAASLDKEGRLNGYFNISEDKVRKELQTIQDFAKIDFERRTGMSYDDYIALQNQPVTEESYSKQLMQSAISSPFSIFQQP